MEPGAFAHEELWPVQDQEAGTTRQDALFGKFLMLEVVGRLECVGCKGRKLITVVGM